MIQKYVPQRLRFIAAAGLLVLFSAVLHAQQPGTGVITGRVYNQGTNVNLEGAVVRLEGTNYSAATERDGRYRLRVPAGVYRLTASYSGLDASSGSVTVNAGQTVSRDIGLTSEIYQLGEFVVAGEREGNALAITLQRQAPNVKSVVSADAFGELNGNPGELLRKLPGVTGVDTGGETRYILVRGMSQELNTVMVDGNRMANTGSAGTNRHFQMQTLSSEGIDRMEVIKSPTPDMDADSIGGAINMVSTSAFDRAGGRRLSGSFGITNRVKDSRDQELRPHYSISYSEVFREKFGVSINYGKREQLSSSFGWRQQHERNIEDPYYTWYLRGRDFTNERTRRGGNVKLDYKLSDRTRFFFNTSMNKHYENENTAIAIFETGRRVAALDANGRPVGRGAILPGYTNNVTEWRGTTTRPEDNRATLTAGSLNKDAATWHYQLGAVHDFERVKVDYDVYFSDSETEYVNQGTFDIRAHGVGMRVERHPASSHWPEFTQIDGPDIFDVNSYTDYNRLNITNRKAVDQYIGAQVNVRKDLDIAVPAYLKTGLRVREQTRDRHNSPERWTYIGPDVTQFKNFLYDYDFEGRLPKWSNLPFPTIPFRDKSGTTRDYTGFNVATALRESPELFREDIVFNTSERLANKVNFEETITAGYLMGGVDIGRLGILGGVRIENTKTWGKGAARVITPEEAARRAVWRGPVTDEEARRRIEAEFADPFEATGEYRKIFPGLHLKYEAIPGLLLRASWATNIGRPNIGTLVPQTEVDIEDQIVRINNTGLEPQFADNFDLSVEYYFEPVGMLSAGVFLKEIKDFIFTDTGRLVSGGPNNGFGGNYEGFTIRTQSNGGSARVRGFELAYQQQFTFLPGWWSGFGVYANYTRLETKGDYGTGTVSSTDEVEDFRPETANLGISYIRDRYTVRVQANYVGRYLSDFSSDRSQLRWTKGTPQVDLKTGFRINRHLEAYFDVWNIFSDTAAEVYYGGRPREDVERLWMIHAGLRLRL